MIILNSAPLQPITAETISPLNAIWYGNAPQMMHLPQLGHIFLVCPLQETLVTCERKKVDSKHYMLLTQDNVTIENLRPKQASPLLILLISPYFIADMASFLNISSDLQALLHAVPLRQGDSISHLLANLSANLHQPKICEELFMEIIGEVLHLLRLRHNALLKLSHHKQNTVDDLLPRLLQARQFIEADYLEPLKTDDVANYIALSEYHFARLFKTAFDMTVHQYVLRLRLNQARYLLESAESVTEVALSVGYNSLSAFITAFRKYFGMTPSAYKAQFQN